MCRSSYISRHTYLVGHDEGQDRHADNEGVEHAPGVAHEGEEPVKIDKKSINVWKRNVCMEKKIEFINGKIDGGCKWNL